MWIKSFVPGVAHVSDSHRDRGVSLARGSDVGSRRGRQIGLTQRVRGAAVTKKFSCLLTVTSSSEKPTSKISNRRFVESSSRGIAHATV